MYKNAGTTLFRFFSQITRLTDGRTDRQTDKMLDRVCIPRSAVKMHPNKCLVTPTV